MSLRNFSYSLIIPTRNRKKTAVHAIQSALNCAYGNLQIIVADNSDSHDLYSELKQRGWLEKITYSKSDQVLSMRDNWERGIELATGEIVSVIGDDDAVMPDAYLFANAIFSRHDVDVLHSQSAIYKWDCYPLPARRHYIGFKISDAVKLINDPKKILRQAFSYEIEIGTGPGLYYGFVKRRFLDDLKKKRGRWLVDHVPDFDSGYATLMYAKKFAVIERPLFIQGHSASSNSGAMRFTSTKISKYKDYHNDLNDKSQSLWLDSLSNIQSNVAAIVSAQHRVLSEARLILKDDFLKINRQKAWEAIVNGFKSDYDSLSLLSSSFYLKKLAEIWKIDLQGKDISFDYPHQNNLSMIYDQGIIKLNFLQDSGESKNKAAKRIPDRQEIVINGQTAGVANINDAVRLIHSMLATPARSADSEFRGFYIKNINDSHIQIMLDAQVFIENRDFLNAEKILLCVVSNDSKCVDAYRLLALLYKMQGKFNECPPLLARVFSITLSFEDLEVYFLSLLDNNSPDIVVEQIQNLSASDPTIALRKGIIKILQQATLMIIKNSSVA